MEKRELAEGTSEQEREREKEKKERRKGERYAGKREVLISPTLTESWWREPGTS